MGAHDRNGQVSAGDDSDLMPPVYPRAAIQEIVVSSILGHLDQPGHVGMADHGQRKVKVLRPERVQGGTLVIFPPVGRYKSVVFVRVNPWGSRTGVKTLYLPKARTIESQVEPRTTSMSGLIYSIIPTILVISLPMTRSSSPGCWQSPPGIHAQRGFWSSLRALARYLHRRPKVCPRSLYQRPGRYHDSRRCRSFLAFPPVPGSKGRRRRSCWYSLWPAKGRTYPRSVWFPGHLLLLFLAGEGNREI